jgi:trimethylamine---corrinoid protein Co-methyltransferase
MKVNTINNETVQFKVLSEAQIEKIVSSSYLILERVGVEVNDDEVLKLLKGAGCIVKDRRAFIPSSLVKECLSYAPSTIQLCGRNGELAMVCEKNNIYFGTGSECVFLDDPYTGERRKWLTEDIGNAAKVSDSLSNIDFHMSLGLLSDAPTKTYDVFQFAAMIKNTKKPIVTTAIDKRSLEDFYNMSCMLRDNEDDFRLKPSFSLYIETITPLIHSKEVLGKIKFSAAKGIPTIYTNAPNAGATSPVTLAATISLGAAEYLSGLVIAQLIKKGTPIIAGGTLFAMDMKTGLASYGSTENYLMDAAMTEVGKYFNIPVFSLAGCSSSKIFDGQATLESIFGVLAAALSGANIIHDVGYLEDGLKGSFEQLVMTDEIIGMVKRFISGVEVNQNTLALDLIEKVGPGGNFLGEKHTADNFKNEYFFPELIDRNNYFNWEKNGKKSLETRVNEKVKIILENYQPEKIEEKKMEKIDKYLQGINR